MVEGRARRDALGATILVVDDELLVRETLAEYLSQEGYAVTASASSAEALARSAEQRFDVALCDVQLLERLHRLSPDTSVLLITAYAAVKNAVEAFQRGAHDYLMKPILFDEVLGKVRRLLAHRALCLENQWLRRELDNALQRAAVPGEGPPATPADLAPVEGDPALVDDLGEAVRRFEKRHIERVLRRATDKREAARCLGMGLSSLYRRISELGIQT